MAASPGATPASVTKAFSDSIGTTLTTAGFLRDGSKRFRRLSGDICQCVFLNVESRRRREFMIEFCTFLTVVPHTHYPLDLGGRFPAGSRGTWYRADTEERLAQSISTVCDHLPPLLDWLRDTSTIEGYVGSYLSLRQTQPPALSHNGHSTFDLACAYLLAGNRTEASRLIVIASDEFESILARTPGTREWSAPCRDRCRELADRIQSITYHTLLNIWRQATYAALKIPA